MMKTWKQALSIGMILVFLLLSMTGCSESAATKAFDSYIAQLPAELIEAGDMDLNYLFLNKSTYGFAQAVYELPFNTQEDYEDSIRESKEIIKKLSSFSSFSLNSEQRLTKEILLDYLKRNIRLQSFYYFHNSYLGSSLGFQAQLPLLLAEYAFQTREDVESYFHLLETSPDIFSKYAEQERQRQKHGAGMPQVILEKVIEQCENFTGEKRPFLVDAVNAKLDGLDFLGEAEKKAAKEKNEALLTGSFLEAYQKLGQALKTIHSDNPDLGLSHQENGKQYYEALLQAQTGTDMTVPQVKRFLEERSRQYLDEFYALGEQYPALQTRLEQGEALKYGGFKTAGETLDYLREEMTKDFPELHNLNYEIKKVQESMKDNFSPAAYLKGRIDAPADAPETIYINGGDIQELFPILAHEGYPGHMYQHSYFKAVKAPVVRYLVDYNGYSEGWADYVQNSAWKYADVTEEEKILLHMAQLNEQYTSMQIALWDIGIHFEGWDRARFTDEVRALYGQSVTVSMIKEQYDLILETPTNYLQYYFNGAWLEQQYEQAEAALGKQFRPSEFHKVVLETGPAPQKILLAQIKKYMNSARKAGDTVQGSSLYQRVPSSGRLRQSATA